MQCSPYFRRYFETLCIKLIVSKLSDLFSDITIVLEFSKWTIYIQACNFSRLKVPFNLYVKRTAHRQILAPNLISETKIPILAFDIQFMNFDQCSQPFLTVTISWREFQ